MKPHNHQFFSLKTYLSQRSNQIGSSHIQTSHACNFSHAISQLEPYYIKISFYHQSLTVCGISIWRSAATCYGDVERGLPARQLKLSGWVEWWRFGFSCIPRWMIMFLSQSRAVKSSEWQLMIQGRKKYKNRPPLTLKNWQPPWPKTP